MLGALGLILVVETFVAGHELDFSRFFIHDWNVAGRAARALTRGRDVLCFGDSLVKFGVAPRVLEECGGRRAYNLAVCDGQAASSYFLFRRALEAGARPSAIVVDFVPHLLAPDPRHNLRQWPELLGVRELLDLGWNTRHAGFFASLVLGSALPSVKARHEIRSLIAAKLRGESPPTRLEIAMHRRCWRLDLGAELSPERPWYRGEVDVANPGYFPRKWSCHPTNERYLRRLLDLASARRIHVFWLVTPVVPRFQQRRDELGLEAVYSRFLRNYQARYPGLTVVDGRRAGFDPGLFIDPLHLNRKGATRLSASLAVLLGSGWSGAKPAGTWLDLPQSSQGSLGRSADENGPRLAQHLPDEGEGR